jgi:hypothetical protein
MKAHEIAGMNTGSVRLNKRLLKVRYHRLEELLKAERTRFIQQVTKGEVVQRMAAFLKLAS